MLKNSEYDSNDSKEFSQSIKEIVDSGVEYAPPKTLKTLGATALKQEIGNNEVLYNQLETTQPKNNADEYLNIDIKSAIIVEYSYRSVTVIKLL